jgi:Protein of unknown function (DUF2752)
METFNSSAFKSSTKERVLAATGLLGMTIGGFAVGYFNPVTAGFFPLCPFHVITGLNCPGCGMTRGFNALFQGDVLGALHFNALIPFFTILFSYFALSLLLVVVRGYGLNWKIFTPKIVTAFLILTMIYAVGRNLPFYPFNLLVI